MKREKTEVEKGFNFLSKDDVNAISSGKENKADQGLGIRSKGLGFKADSACE